MNAFIAIPSSWLIAMSTVFADRCHEACFLDTCLLCVTGPSHTHTCQRTPGPTCVVLQHRDLGHGGNCSVHTTSDEVKTRLPDLVGSVTSDWLITVADPKESHDALFELDGAVSVQRGLRH